MPRHLKPTGLPSLLLALLTLTSLALWTEVADATITEFSSGLTPASKPMGLIPGPDGNLWFTHYGNQAGASPAIGRITPAGTIAEFRDGLGGGNPRSIVVGPDGNLWFGIGEGKSSAPAIGRITPQGVITRFTELMTNTSPSDLTIGPGSRIWFVSAGGTRPGLGYVKPSGLTLQISLPYWPTDIVAGPDGNMWFTYGEGSAAAIARIDSPEDPGDTTITYFRDGLREESDPRQIVLGRDGNLWFSDPWIDAIGKVTSDGAITEFDAPGFFRDSFVPGPDGNIWWTDWGLNRIAPSGEIKHFGTPGSGESRNPEDLAFGPGGDLWFTSSRFEDPGNGAVGRMTSSGSIEEYNVGINPGSWPLEIVLGPDGNFWFTDWGEPSAIGRVTLEGNAYRSPWESEPETQQRVDPPTRTYPPIPRVATEGRRVLVDRNGIARLKLYCIGSQACTGTLMVRAKKRSWRADRTVGLAPFSISAGRSTRLSLRINRVGRALLRDGRGQRWARLTALPGGLLTGYSVKLIARG
ncbi:MAG TPA: hypothetical protein VK889_05955 [Solirubrobacterales bacterium]|nr:hypothetical protein [Solirubrobacterales bacterium]